MTPEPWHRATGSYLPVNAIRRDDPHAGVTIRRSWANVDHGLDRPRRVQGNGP
jgi:hypothetical protein